MKDDPVLLGCRAFEAGDNPAAIRFFTDALRSRPGDPHLHILIGLALLAEGQGEGARAALAIACLRGPELPQAHAVHGRVLASLGRREEALAAFDRAVALDGGHVEALHERAVLLLAAGRGDEALAGFRAVAALRPEDPATLGNLGAALLTTGRVEEADRVLTAALEAAPGGAEALANRGLARAAIGRLDEALADVQAARVVAPADRAVRRALANVQYERDERGAARGVLEALVGEAPEDAQARFNLGIIDLAEERLSAGWEGFEFRAGLLGGREAVGWDGGRREGTLLLAAEQGIGDTLFFLRYARLAAERTRVALMVPQTFRRAVSGLGLPVVSGGAAGEVLRLGSLARVFSPSVDAIPPPFASWFDPVASARWGQRLRAGGGALVGLVWAGSAGYRQDRRRSIAPSLLEPLREVAGVRFVSVGQGALPWMADPGPLHDLAETAALVASLDLVITVDTAMAHLAAGLGGKVWLMDRAGGDWRWFRGREESPWYPGLRIFRQERAEVPERAWPGVVGRVRDALIRQFADLSDITPLR